MEKSLKIVFMGTPDFALESLKAIYEKGYNVCGVLTKVDMPSGRGMKMSMSKVKEFAITKGIKVYQPEKLKDNDEIYETLKQISPDVIVVVAYGKILPKKILDLAKFGAINVHGSILPKYRGAAPIQWAVLNGDKETGITIMYMDAGMDTGPIILTKKVEIQSDDTSETMYNKLKVVGAQALVETLDRIKKTNSKLDCSIQVGEPSFAPMINKEMAKIDFNKKAHEVVNLVRGMANEPYAWCKLDETRIYKIVKVTKIDTQEFDNNINGEIVYLSAKENAFFVKCADAVINIERLKPAGKNEMSATQYILGNKVKIGERFI